jgi:predicted phage terminase large subunit-like protein
MATSVGGRATGEHPDRKIVDDPTNAAQAASDAERETANLWFDRTLSTRGESRGARTVVIMQRLHESDLTGHIIAKDYGYEHLCLPMKYEHSRRLVQTSIGWSDPRSTDGSLLWPEMFDAQSVAKLERLLGSYGAAGQLQQRPAPEGGGILRVEHFQKWPHGTELPVFEFVVQSYDTAFEEKESNDPSAGTAWGMFTWKGKRQAMLLDAWADQLPYPKLRAKVIEEWHSVYGKTAQRKGRKADHVLIEKKASGQSLLQDLRAANIPAVPYLPVGGKVPRAHQAAPILELDCLWIPESGKEPGEFVTWARPFVNQLEKFPNAEHDDLCVSAGTLITMGDGSELPVEQVSAGDLVLTPVGPRVVTEARFTGVRPVFKVQARNRELLATGNHPVGLSSGVYSRIDTLSQTAEVVWLSSGQLLWAKLRSLYSTGIGIVGTKMRGSMHTVRTSTGLASFCTGLFGSIFVGQSQAVGTSTMLMAIPETMTSAIYNVLTPLSTERSSTVAANLRKFFSTLITSGTLQALGTPLQRVRLGIAKMLGTRWQRPKHLELRTLASTPGLSLRSRVSGVVRRFSSSLRRLSTVLSTAVQRHLGSAVLVRVSPPITEAPVYNLTVADAHCFYANRFLTHNCDTFTQAMIYLRDAGWFELEAAAQDEVEEVDYHALRKRKMNPYAQ